MVIELKLVISGIIAALIALLGNRLLDNRKNERSKKQLINSLFGELLHVLQHYGYSEKSIENRELTYDEIESLKRNLLFKKYGEFSSSKDFDKYGFLTSEEIKNLLQLSFRIRNTDSLIDQVLSSDNKITTEQFNEILERAHYIIASTQHLLRFMSSTNEEFKKLVTVIESKIK